jgi:aspartate racemase
MKKIGIIGGIGPESTVDYYKRITGAFQEGIGPYTYPEIIVYSANLTALMEMLEAKAWDRITDWLVERVEALHRAGAEFAVIGSNTPHRVFGEVEARSPIPMLSIVEETAKKAQALGLRNLGLLGTRFTMQSDFFMRAFTDRGMSVVVPGTGDQELIHQRLFSEIELGIIKESTRDELVAVVKRMMDQHAIDSVILGCTELPLILPDGAFGIPFLNTTAIHAESIVRFCKET